VLYVTNKGPIADSYNLSSTLALPSGWSVSFKADGGSGNCSTTGAVLSSTPSVAANGSTLVCAVVTVPAGYAAGTVDFNFRALSPVTGAGDTINDAVLVNALRSLSIIPNQSGQVFPAGSVVYSHTVTNTGNVIEGNGTVSTIVLGAANSQAGWTSVQYYDANGNGVLDATDPAIPAAGLQAVLPAGLAPGQSITVFDKVLAPSGAANGVVDITTLTLTTTNGSYVSTAPGAVSAVDTSTVVADNVTLTKTQGLDAACTGHLAASAYSNAPISAGAVPGACIDYQITVQNVGSANATGVVVSDATPSYTLMAAAPTPTTTVGTITAPAAGSAGTVSATVGTLAPGQSAVVTFGVQIQP